MVQHTPAQSSRAVRIENLHVAFDGTPALAGVDLVVHPGETVALLGPSGCGKTTLLRVLAGLLRPDQGRVHLGQDCVADAAARRTVPPEQRDVGMVFQDYALWPHMTVAENVAFPLQMRGVRRAERHRRTAEVLELVGLADLGDRSPGTLSGGQQQRVALARALAARPGVVLFDEPLSNLDRELRDGLVDDIGELVRRVGVTAVYVTHDQAEAFGVADRVGVLVEGRLRQLGAPGEVFLAPADVAVARFIKPGALIDGAVDDAGTGFVADAGGARLPVAVGQPGTRGRLLVPRAAMAIASQGHGGVSGEVVRCRFRGDDFAVRLRLAGDSGPEVVVHDPDALAVGTVVSVHLQTGLCRFFPEGNDTAPSQPAAPRQGSPDSAAAEAASA